MTRIRPLVPALCLAPLILFSSPLSAQFAARNLGHAKAWGTESVVRQNDIVLVADERADLVDLNGDGDQLDRVVLRWKVGSPDFQVVPWSIPYRVSPQVSGDTLAIAASENGRDLNGDGDGNDIVPLLFDLHTELGRTLPYAIATRSPRFHGSSISFLVDEATHFGGDLNGDGDALDLVVHTHDPATGAVDNLGLAVRTVPPSGLPLTIRVSEADHGSTDLNGDGDALDNVLHVHDGELRNLGISAVVDPLPAHGKLAFLVHEQEEGNTDLTGDGGRTDRVVHVHDLELGKTTNLGWSVQRYDLVGDRYFVASAFEPQSARDFNGDGERFGAVSQIYDMKTGETSNVGSLLFPDEDEVTAFAGTKLVNVIWETGATGDLNGNGQLFEGVLHVYDLETKTLRNVGIHARWPVGGDNGLYFSVWEISEQVDITGDDDLDDSPIFRLGPDDKEPTYLGYSGVAADGVVSSRAYLVRLWEAELGEDVNRDGDLADRIAFLYDPLAEEWTNLGFSIEGYPLLSDRLFLMASRETDEQRDLNGDGQIGDVVHHVLDVGGCLGQGNVNAGRGVVTDVLFLNGESGRNAGRVVEYDVLSPFRIEMRLPPILIGTGETAPFALYAWLGEPDPSSNRVLPFGLGVSCRVLPFLGETTGNPRFIWNNAGRRAVLGIPNRPSRPAPSTVVSRSRTVRPATFYMQALIYDPASAARVPASLSNGILARPVVR